MSIGDYAALLIAVIILAAVIVYIVKQKKKGVRCIGCKSGCKSCSRCSKYIDKTK